MQHLNTPPRGKSMDIRPPAPRPQKKKRGIRIPSFLKKMNKNVRLLLIGLAVLAAGLFIKSYVDTRNELNRLANPKTAANEAAADITTEIGKYLDLPQDEVPTVATVKDTAEIKKQPFFKNVQNGDKILIYEKSGQTVIYRPSTKKVIQYAPVNTDDK